MIVGQGCSPRLRLCREPMLYILPRLPVDNCLMQVVVDLPFMTLANALEPTGDPS